MVFPTNRLIYYRVPSNQPTMLINKLCQQIMPANHSPGLEQDLMELVEEYPFLFSTSGEVCMWTKRKSSNQEVFKFQDPTTPPHKMFRDKHGIFPRVHWKLPRNGTSFCM
ncbi:hypothetical protein P5673_011235 [Acropora cervicornis]|uniref:Uncharacterized protein n=1 Tax=Acropora cervicornis TaxID=6130 RepID=A0AAD9V8M5_ACRCE|nr:hypothetical protein P5673_011235 [Acropora cervicornis]